MSKANILVVDDQDSIRHFVSKALEEDGYTVMTTGSIRESRQVLEREIPDLAILDFKLPDGTGIELLREIKRMQPEVSVILMTAFESPEVRAEARRLKVDKYVRKPFDLPRMLTEIHDLIGAADGDP